MICKKAFTSKMKKIRSIVPRLGEMGRGDTKVFRRQMKRIMQQALRVARECCRKIWSNLRVFEWISIYQLFSLFSTLQDPYKA